MKKTYLYILTVLITILTYTPISAQLTKWEILGEYSIIREDLLLEGFEIYLGTDNCCGEETFDDIRFGYNISAALFSHNLIKAAREKSLNDWFDKQNNLIKEEIEKQLYQKFSNFPDAQTAFYKNLEKINIGNNISVPRNKYIKKVALRVESRNKSIRNLKLLELRENEIKAGIISNSNYGYLKFTDTPLNQITSLSQLETLRTAEIKVFGDRDWPFVEDTNILTKLREIPYDNEDILKRLTDKQISYYNSFESWGRLDLMQLYLNHVKTSYVLAYQSISPVDYATPNYLENYAIGFASPYKSPFHPDVCPPIRVYLGGRIGWIEKTDGACMSDAILKRQQVLDEAMLSMSDAAFIAQNVIEILNYDIHSTEAKWLNRNLTEAGNINRFLTGNMVGNNIPVNFINFAKVAIEALMNGGEVDWEDNIINNLYGKSLCIYMKLLKSSSQFKNHIKKFDGEFPVSHLEFDVDNTLPSNNYGRTYSPENYITKIVINENSLANISDLGKVLVFSHEIIHAEIFRKMLSAAKRGDLSGSYTIQNRINFVNSLKNNFSGLYDYYVERYKPTWQHNMMAAHYRQVLADIMTEFDNKRLTRQDYEDIAWVGLKEYEGGAITPDWFNQTEEDKNRINSKISQYFHKGPSNCN